MAQPQAKVMGFPAITLFFVSASLVTYAVPGLSDLLVYDRQRVLAGQLWRLWTAPLVHFSASHLVWNILALAAAGSLIEHSGYRKFGLACLLATILPGILFVIMEPDLAEFGGLSSVATGAIAYGCLCRAREDTKGRVTWLALLGLLAAKIPVETITGNPLFGQPDGLPFQVLPFAHLIGSGAGMIAYAFGEARKVDYPLAGCSADDTRDSDEHMGHALK